MAARPRRSPGRALQPYRSPFRREAPSRTFAPMNVVRFGVTGMVGQGTDATQRGRSMWARVKGHTENALLALPFRAAYMFRPGLIQPLHVIRSRTPLYHAIYTAMGPLSGLLRRWAPGMATSTGQAGRAMLRVAREGYPTRVLETRDINRLASAPRR